MFNCLIHMQNINTVHIQNMTWGSTIDKQVYSAVVLWVGNARWPRQFEYMLWDRQTDGQTPNRCFTPTSMDSASVKMNIHSVEAASAETVCGLLLLTTCVSCIIQTQHLIIIIYPTSLLPTIFSLNIR